VLHELAIFGFMAASAPQSAPIAPSAPIRRFKVVVAFDGTDFHGWQIQQNAEPTVQGCIELRLNQFFGDFQSIRSVVNGRTDKGVSARGAVFHFDLLPQPDHPKFDSDPRTAGPRCTPQLLLSALRNQPRQDISVLSVDEVSAESFHARGSVQGKQYRYTLLDAQSAGGGTASPFNVRWCWPLGAKVSLDLKKMNNAAARLVGTRDFSHFAIMQEGDEREPVRQLRRLDIVRVDTAEFEGDSESGCSTIGRVLVVAEADFFLYKMCRKIVGTLVAVGRGALPEEAIDEILNGNGVGRVVTAPASGLCLQEVFY